MGGGFVIQVIKKCSPIVLHCSKYCNYNISAVTRLEKETTFGSVSQHIEDNLSIFGNMNNVAIQVSEHVLTLSTCKWTREHFKILKMHHSVIYTK